MERTDKVVCQHVTGMLPVNVSFETFEDTPKFASLLIGDVYVTLHRPEVEVLCGYMMAWLGKEH